MSDSSDSPGGRRGMAGNTLMQTILEQAQTPPPQRKVDEFWRNFTTKAPGKGK
jgi:hypothetical protein